MADANARINIDINTSAAAAGLRQLQSQITAFNSTLTKSSTVQATAMRNSTQNMLELVNASRFFSAETVRMQTAAASLDTTLKKGQVTLGTFLGAKFRKNSLAAAQVMSLANTRAQALQTQFLATGAAANGMRDAIAIRPLQAFNNAAVVSAQKLAIHRAMLNQATTSMINFGKNTQWTGRQLMVGFTVPLTIFGGVAGKVFRDLEKEAVNFKKVYGDSFTPPEEMEANLNAVKELAKEYTKYGIAVKDTVGLAAEAAAAGAQNAELIDATTQATRLATLGQMEQNEALKTTISLQNAFKLSGDELANSINFLNMVENQTVVTLQDLSGAIPRVAPVIKGLGGDVRDLATFLAAMQEGGVSAAQGSMALKSGLASLINPTEKAKERLAEMGISIDTIIQANKGDLMGTVQALAAALDTLDQFGRQQAIEELFGKFQYARLAALFDNINKEGTQAARVMEISAMSAAEMAASAEKELGAIEEAVGTKFVAAMEQLKLAIAPIGELFTKMAIPVINFLAKIADAFNNLPDGAKTFIGIATAIVGIVIPAGTMFLGLLVNLIGTLVKFGSTIGIAFRGFLSGGIKGAFDAVSQSTKYMSLAEIDAANSAQQLAGSTEAVNKALLGQVGSSETAQAAIMELAYAYEILTTQMREAALQSKLVFGPGAAAMGNVPGRGPIRRNRGGSIPGSGNTDTVPAMLTPGEFVVNKKSTQENLGLLKYINQGGNVPGFNIGGLLAATGAAVRSRSLLSGAQVAGALGVSERTLRRISASAGLPKAGGKYLYTPETIPTLAAQTNVRMQKTHTTPFRSITTMPSTIPGSSQRAQLSKLMAGAGIPIQVVDDAWLLLPSGVNQKLRAGGVQGSQLLEAIEDFSRQPGFFGPAYRNVDKERFISSLRSSIRPDAMYTDYGQNGGLNAGALFWSAARKSAPQGGFIPTQVGGYTANTQAFRNSVGTLNKRYAGQYSFSLDETGKKPVMRVFDSKGNRVLTEDIQASAGWGFNKGGQVPGVQYLRGGGGVRALSRAAQLKAIREADGFGILGGNVEDKSLRSILRLGFNDTRTDSPSDFVKAMFGRWETTPTRTSPKENTTMLLKGKKPKYAPVSQEDYLANMITSGNKFSDVVDAFKPITIGRMRGRDETRVFDGHTRIHSQLVKGLIETKLGLNTSRMSREQLVNAIRTIRAMSIDGKITNTDVMRATSGQKVLVRRASERDVDRLFDHPLRRRPMASMMNREGRTLIPGIHDTEIESIVNAARKANFYGVKKDPESLMKSMGFVSLDGGSRFRYDPGVDFRNRSSYVNNMGRRITDDLIDRGEILPLRRNRGGFISPTLKFGNGNIVPGLGNTDTVPAMLTPGEFVINKKATQENIGLLHAINNGQILAANTGGEIVNIDGKYYVDDGKGGTRGPFKNEKNAAKAAAKITKSGSRGMMGMGMGRGMGLSMGMGMAGGAMFMGSTMMPNQGAATAMQIGGTALSVGSMLPMLGGMAPMLAPLAGIAAPAAAVAAGLAVAGVAVYKWRQSVDEAARSAANFGANLGGTANAFNQIASLMGTMTPAQRQTALQIGFDQEAQSAISEQFSAMFGTEEGQQFITDLENATSEERFKKLSDYLKAGIAAGMMDTEMASNLAKAVSVSINDAVLGARVVGAISSQETGAGAVAEMARARAENVSSLSEFTRVVKEQGILLEQTDAAKIIGGSIQTIQDYSNATALAREQLAKGEITQEQYSKIISESESQQALFTKAIEESLIHTRDFGGTMQATLDQLTKAGLATEEGLQNLSKAAEEARFGRNVPGAVGTQQNLFAAGIAAVAGGMEQGIAAAIIERIGQDERAQESFAQLSRAGVGGAQALAGTEFVSQIRSGQMFGDRMRGQQLGVTAARAQQFAARGGDITGAQAYLLSQPLEERAGVAQSFFALRDEDKSTLIKDYQDLAQNAGAEFARNLVDSEEYREALKEGSTEEFTQSIKRASSIFGEKTESIMDYAKRTGISLEELSNQAERLASLPDELIFKLGIDFTDPADMQKFGPMADQLKASWPILSQLPPELDLRAFVETNTLENGQLAPISKIADGVVKVTKAYAALDSTESDVVKKASIEIMTAQGSTLEAAESTFKTLIDNMKDFNNFNLESKYALITLQTAIDEVGLKMSLIQQAVAEGDMPASAALNQIESLSGKRGALQAELDVAKVQAEITARAPSAGSKSGGGTPEKTLAEQLEEQRKLVESFANRFGSKRGVKLLAKPFGPEFLQYLKSQGQKGLDMLKGNFKKMRSAYKDFAAAQKAESLVVLQFMPGKLTEELEARKNSLQLIKQITKEEGMSLQTATQAVNVLDATQQADYISLISKKKLSKEDKNRLNLYKEILSISKQTALFDEQNAEVMQFMNMSAEERESARISNLQDIQSINRQIEEIKVLEPLQKQLDAQQKIIDASQRAIELKQRESDEISRAIELKERELEPFDEQIEKLEEQQDKVQEIYDEQIEALDKIFEQESEIIALREKSLDVADALSTGDIAAAARAQMQLQSELAAQRREDQRSLLEAQNEAEIAAIDEQINDIKEQRVAIEEEVERLQLKQRSIQDEIYKLNQNQIPVQDEIYRLQQRIASETDRLNSKYDDTNLRLQSLNAQLNAALATQNAINQAAAEENKIRAQKAQQAAAVAPTAPKPLTPGDPGYDQVSANIQEMYGGKPNEMYVLDPNMGLFGPGTELVLDFSMYNMGGKVKKYAMGGMVNYKGSREPAPGFAMGGRVKKYAYGSIVPGIGATDKVPAMLTPGEFVVRKSVAQTYGPLLSAINGNVFPKMGGSSAMPRGSAKGSGSMYNYNVNVTLNGSDMNPDDVANAVMRKIKMTENTRVRGYNTRG